MRTEGHVTSTELSPSEQPVASPASWDVEFHRLRARFPRAKDSILFCIHALQSNEGIALDDLKAQASMHRIRVTGASVTAARLQMRRGVPGARPSSETAPEVREPRAKRPELVDATNDPGELVQRLVEQMQLKAEVEALRLRQAIRSVIAVLREALG